MRHLDLGRDGMSEQPRSNSLTVTFTPILLENLSTLLDLSTDQAAQCWPLVVPWTVQPQVDACADRLQVTNPDAMLRYAYISSGAAVNWLQSAEVQVVEQVSPLGTGTAAWGFEFFGDTAAEIAWHEFHLASTVAASVIPALPHEWSDAGSLVISRRDHARYISYSGDNNIAHVDPAEARRQGFADIVIHGQHLLAAVTAKLKPAGVLREAGMEFLSPVYPDETLSLEIESNCVERRGLTSIACRVRARGETRCRGFFTVDTGEGAP